MYKEISGVFVIQCIYSHKLHEEKPYYRYFVVK